MLGYACIDLSSHSAVSCWSNGDPTSTNQGVPATEAGQGGDEAFAGIRQGLQATKDHPVIYNVLLITFASSIFNAGAFITIFHLSLREFMTAPPGCWRY